MHAQYESSDSIKYIYIYISIPEINARSRRQEIYI